MIGWYRASTQALVDVFGGAPLREDLIEADSVTHDESLAQHDGSFRVLYFGLCWASLFDHLRREDEGGRGTIEIAERVEGHTLCAAVEDDHYRHGSAGLPPPCTL